MGFTPKVEEGMARLGTWMPFRAAQRELAFFLGVEVAEASVRHITGIRVGRDPSGLFRFSPRPDTSAGSSPRRGAGARIQARRDSRSDSRRGDANQAVPCKRPGCGFRAFGRPVEQSSTCSPESRNSCAPWASMNPPA